MIGFSRPNLFPEVLLHIEVLACRLHGLVKSELGHFLHVLYMTLCFLDSLLHTSDYVA